jgi:PhnB protein
MQTRLNPYLGFRDNARQAMEFYHSVFGGELTLNTFGESQVTDDPTQTDKIMHGMLTTPDGMTLMGADTPSEMDYTPGSNYSVSLSGDNETELRGYWKKLSESGTPIEPLEKAPWGDWFGMCVDGFGVTWLVNIAGEAAEG